MISATDRAEARRDALSHLTKGTLLTDAAVKRICEALTQHPDAGTDTIHDRHSPSCVAKQREDAGAVCVCKPWSPQEAP